MAENQEMIRAMDDLTTALYAKNTVVEKSAERSDESVIKIAKTSARIANLNLLLGMVIGACLTGAIIYADAIIGYLAALF